MDPGTERKEDFGYRYAPFLKNKIKVLFYVDKLKRVMFPIQDIRNKGKHNIGFHVYIWLKHLS